ncbi:MAG: VWA domain-containing protein [Acidobacteriia bacterium]|nr:VWA domain-containing protein [Terriglobia bacterium]
MAHWRQYITQFRGMRQMPGRNALVLLTEGVVPDFLLDGVIDEANRAGVAICPVDVRGVVFTGMTASERVFVSSGSGRLNPTSSIDSATGSRVNVFENSRRGMSRLAGETGGVFLQGDNDIGALLANAVEEIGDYYLIGCQPQRGDYGTKFHRVQIKVKRRGVHATTRSGFPGAPGRDTTAALERMDLRMSLGGVRRI